jgi:hypothetical protein
MNKHPAYRVFSFKGSRKQSIHFSHLSTAFPIPEPACFILIQEIHHHRQVPMQNYSNVLDQTTWGIHLNFEGHYASPPNPPSWLTQLQQQDWQQRGIVLWDAYHRVVAHLYASYAFELLKHLHNDTAWKTEGLVIGSPTFQLSANSANTPSTKVGGDWVLKNQIELSGDQTQTLFEFISAQEGLLKHISVYDKKYAEQALNKVYQLIADYSRKERERKGTRELIANREPKVMPTSIPRGSYFTVYQAAQVCQVTSKQIRAWVRKGKLEAFDLPGSGLIIEVEKLNEFLYKRDLDSQ